MASNSSDVDTSEFEDNSEEFSPDSEDDDHQQVNFLCYILFINEKLSLFYNFSVEQ